VLADGNVAYDPARAEAGLEQARRDGAISQEDYAQLLPQMQAAVRARALE
jgi:hypothetical protein